MVLSISAKSLVAQLTFSGASNRDAKGSNPPSPIVTIEFSKVLLRSIYNFVLFAESYF